LNETTEATPLSENTAFAGSGKAAFFEENYAKSLSVAVFADDSRAASRIPQVSRRTLLMVLA
jgi:hypothetical protein